MKMNQNMKTKQLISIIVTFFKIKAEMPPTFWVQIELDFDCLIFNYLKIP